jgi:hypothetical protein
MITTTNRPKIKRNKDGTITGLPQYGDRALAKKVVGIRFTQEVFDKLQEIEDKQNFIREAVAEKLEREN